MRVVAYASAPDRSAPRKSWFGGCAYRIRIAARLGQLVHYHAGAGSGGNGNGARGATRRGDGLRRCPRPGCAIRGSGHRFPRRYLDVGRQELDSALPRPLAPGAMRHGDGLRRRDEPGRDVRGRLFRRLRSNLDLGRHRLDPSLPCALALGAGWPRDDLRRRTRSGRAVRRDRRSSRPPRHVDLEWHGLVSAHAHPLTPGAVRHEVGLRCRPEPGRAVRRDQLWRWLRRWDLDLERYGDLDQAHPYA